MSKYISNAAKASGYDIPIPVAAPAANPADIRRDLRLLSNTAGLHPDSIDDTVILAGRTCQVVFPSPNGNTPYTVLRPGDDGIAVLELRGVNPNKDSRAIRNMKEYAQRQYNTEGAIIVALREYLADSAFRRRVSRL